MANIDLMEMSLFFLRKIKEKLNAKGWSRALQKDDFVFINSTQYEYCWDCVRLIQKYLSDEKWECKMTHYLKTNGVYSYTWSFRLKKRV